jgi:hypothetical protein
MLVNRSATPVLLVCAVVALAIAVARRHELSSSMAVAGVPGAQPANKKSDICGLLTAADIQSVQGERLEGTVPGTQPTGGLVMSQCMFRTAKFNKSVSLAVAVPDPASAISPRNFWDKQFHRSADAEHKTEMRTGKGESRAAEPNEGDSKPRRIAGLGEEAYWMGNPITGALYVLQGRRFLRISVGGIRDEATRIENSKSLARAALKRL